MCLRFASGERTLGIGKMRDSYSKSETTTVWWRKKKEVEEEEKKKDELPLSFCLSQPLSAPMKKLFVDFVYKKTVARERETETESEWVNSVRICCGTILDQTVPSFRRRCKRRSLLRLWFFFFFSTWLENLFFQIINDISYSLRDFNLRSVFSFLTLISVTLLQYYYFSFKIKRKK